MELINVRIGKPTDTNFILGQSHFIKTIEDLHEPVAQTVPQMKFGIAFCSSGPALVRWTGTTRNSSISRRRMPRARLRSLRRQLRVGLLSST